MGLTRKQVQPIGVDFGLDSIKMLQLEVVPSAPPRGESLSVVAAARQAVPADAQASIELRMPMAVEMIRQLLRQNEFHGREIVCALPRELVHVKNLRLPMIPPGELEAAIQFEAQNIFPFDVSQAHVRHLYAGEVRQGSDTRQEVIVLAAKCEEVDLFVEQLHRSGCMIAALDFEPSAIYRTVERFIRRREDEQEVNVLVDIGARQSQVVVGKGRDISFFKAIEIGGLHLHEAVARKLQISSDEARSLRRRLIDSDGSQSGEKSDAVRQAVFDATRSTTEELAREIALCLRYYSVTFRGHRPGKVRLIGGESADPQIQSTLAGALPIPVEAMRPLYSCDASRMKPTDGRGDLGEWATALGLGLKMTRAYFGARDGRRREAGVAIAPAESAAAAEVIDLASAMHPTAPAASAVAQAGRVEKEPAFHA